MLKINLLKKFDNFVLQADCQLPAKGITVLFGLSGSGKSSLINAISGLLPVDQGFVEINQRILLDTDKAINLPIYQRNIGYVFQDARLFPHYSVKGNLKYGIKKYDEKEFNKIVRLLGLQPLLKRYPLSLSGGEKQRVAIGRALLSQPDMLLMDEPLSALDLPRKQELLGYLLNLSEQIAIPILYVTHSLEELCQLADRVLFFQQGKAKLFSSLTEFIEHPDFQDWQQAIK